MASYFLYPALVLFKEAYADNSGIPEQEVDTINMEAFYILQGDYIDASLDQAISGYELLQAYFRDAPGISAEETRTLRAQLLNCHSLFEMTASGGGLNGSSATG